jgi:hypothetical protein
MKFLTGYTAGDARVMLEGSEYCLQQQGPPLLRDYFNFKVLSGHYNPPPAELPSRNSTNAKARRISSSAGDSERRFLRYVPT